MTLAELRTYLTEMLALVDQYDADARVASLAAANAEAVAARMWKHFTPQALSMWTIPGVLEHIAQCMSPPEKDENESDEEDEE